ncbi:MAG: 2,3-bisphosphoglycerate-independent phosphoglycerate mutase [Elusimicrobia bacterium]|nr:2,3-bisphosphoglycerate-independent phosphoglycerate mutase [Elusimicrobiota bacterium]
MTDKRVLLIVRDGWGIARPDKYNAVYNAAKPNVDGFLRQYPNTVLEAAGVHVGLPGGYQGSSEVGHLNMGAGRIVTQELKRIMDMLKEGTLFKTQALKNAIDNCLKNNSNLHLMGLVQDEGVHAHQDHLYEIMRHAKERGVKQVYVHFFSDGRDTPPRSAIGFLKILENKISEYSIGTIATVTGRYYAMDRGEKWALIDAAYDAITRAQGRRADSAAEAIEAAYSSMKNPDGADIIDEYIPPTVINGYKGMNDLDSVIHFNFRQDRAIQLTKAFIEDEYPGKRWKKFNITYCGLTRYYDSFLFNAIAPMDESGDMGNLLGEVLSGHGIKQLRISETQKFRHVTSFFNGKMIEPYPLEDRIEIKGTFDPSSFAEHPRMNAPETTGRALKEIESRKYGFILVNFANCDMVGHTGNVNSAVKAVEVVDSCVGQLAHAGLAAGYTVMVTSDHGNAEEMWDYKLNMPKTAHTCNPVEFILMGDWVKGVSLRERGILADIAPTILEVLNIKKPADMTAQSLIKERIKR